MSNHRVDVGGSMFVSNIDSGSVPVDISGTVTQTVTSRDLRFGITPVSGSDKFTDIGIESNVGSHFYINGPTTLEAGKSTLVDLCIDQSGNVGIGKIPTEKLDINGNVFVGNTLTADDTINITNTSLTVNGTLSCNTLHYGSTGNAYSTFPRGTILMTTVTTALDGWTDITSSFYEKMLMIKNNSINNTYINGGNNSVTLTKHITHTHTTGAHNTTHNHSFNLNTPSGSSGNHSHTIAAKTTSSPGNHSHSYTDSANYGTCGNNDGYLSTINLGRNSTNTANNNFTTGEAANNHNHNVNAVNTGSNTHTHSHAVSNDAASSDVGADHVHPIDNSGTAASFNIVPLHYNVRLIKKI